jgi:3-polyprenyl-4-hydroxybenzoate decarboxylase
MHEPLTNLRKLITIQMKNPSESEIWRAFRAAVRHHQGAGKVVVAIDEGIDSEDSDALWWAIYYRSKPYRDIGIIKHTENGHASSFHYPPEGQEVVAYGEKADDSSLLINAVLKESFPSMVSENKKEEKNDASNNVSGGLGRPNHTSGRAA